MRTPALLEALGPGEELVIDAESQGCFHRRKRRIRVSGGSPVTAHFEDGSARSLDDFETEELARWVHHLRTSAREGGCTTTETVTLAWEPSLDPINRESFVDGTCDFRSSDKQGFWVWRNGSASRQH